MKLYLIVLFCVTLNPSSGVSADSSLACGDDSWVIYKDEKCFKLIDQLVTHSEANSICTQLSEIPDTLPPLLTIKSSEEQEFLNQFIFGQFHVLDNVWLGAERSNETGQFIWTDGSIFYTNWHEGSPSENPGYDCTQLVPKDTKVIDIDPHEEEQALPPKGPVDGLWMDVPCGKRNLIICQKLQYWPNLVLQKAVLNLRQNPVPIGFVYVQLPSQPEAKGVWPGVQWTDVTVDYAGLFFRAEGGQSAPFGTQQSESAPRIDAIHSSDCAPTDDIICDSRYIDIPTNGMSAHLFVGAFDLGDIIYHTRLSFNVSGSEVRPGNTAVRIWKRTA